MSTVPKPSSALPRARVLVVDDHPSMATTLARALVQLGSSIEVISATNPRTALERVRDGAVDLLITDMMMPEINGLELIERLRAHPGGRPAFTILITAYDVPGLRESARRLKVNEIIVKPFRMERILEIVRKALDSMTDPAWMERSWTTHRPFKILIADDISDNIMLLARYLENEGYAYISAADGVEALEKTRSEMPDLVLLDVNMPTRDGFSVLQEIRSDPTLLHIPVIMLTAARVDSADMRAGLNLGADDYVTKPFDRRELLARIRTKLRSKETEDAIRRRYNEFSVLPEIGRALSARLDLNELTDIILRQVVETMGALAARIQLFDPQSPLDREYRMAASSGSMSLLKFPPLSELLEQVRHAPASLIINNTRRDPRWGTFVDDPTGSAIIVPLLGRLDVIGLLAVVHERTEYFIPEHQLLLQAIASQASIALDGARLHRSLMQVPGPLPEARAVSGRL